MGVLKVHGSNYVDDYGKKPVIFSYFYTFFSFYIIVLMNCDQSILHIIMSIAFVSIINMGINIKIKVLAAL